MPETSYLLAGVAVTAAVTFGLRVAPFGLASVLRGSPLLADFGRWMPAGAAIVLAVYCVASVDYAAPAHGVPQLAGVAATVLAHLWRRNAVLSIIAGTAVCVALSFALG
ncbi:branched-chain amino acid ABC transporter [Tsukamurella pulmonis]|uniref:branched-chain amino acid transporter permease n=1 Tax=Tsukamurella pulmonis TaxID=47312 RepID=UPI000791AC4E|nr:AzlD domain-containing protein [Tsukamurella pulmonis]KXP13039.1 branched-chain amino acid ABC transporter [Tsukamurella pulmonis]RDH09948.1 branched-chain amino acid ABC transporter [Tsukamurella pulmonis]